MNINITVVADKSFAAFLDKAIRFGALVAREMEKEMAQSADEAKNEEVNEPTSSTPEAVEEPSVEAKNLAYKKLVDCYGVENIRRISEGFNDLFENETVDADNLPLIRDALGENDPVYRYASYIANR